MITQADKITYEIYKALDKPEYFQKYFMKWYECGGFWRDPNQALRVKISIYVEMGISIDEIYTYQDVVPKHVFMDFVNGGELSPKKARQIHKMMPERSEKKTPKVTTNRSCYRANMMIYNKYNT